MLLFVLPTDTCDRRETRSPDTTGVSSSQRVRMRPHARHGRGRGAHLLGRAEKVDAQDHQPSGHHALHLLGVLDHPRLLDGIPALCTPLPAVHIGRFDHGDLAGARAPARVSGTLGAFMCSTRAGCVKGRARTMWSLAPAAMRPMRRPVATAASWDAKNAACFSSRAAASITTLRMMKEYFFFAIFFQ